MSNEACLILDGLIVSAVVGLNTLLLRRTQALETQVGGRRSADAPTGADGADG